MGEYNDEEKTINWGLGHKNHGDKRHRTHVRYEGISYLDGEKIPGPTRQIVTNERVVWSRKQDNRLAQNDETYGTKEMTYDESYNEVTTDSSLDLRQNFSVSGSGSVAGIGGSVSQSTDIHAHTGVATKQWDLTKKERVIDTTSNLLYPGPLYRIDKDENGVVVGPNARGRGSDLDH